MLILSKRLFHRITPIIAFTFNLRQMKFILLLQNFPFNNIIRILTHSYLNQATKIKGDQLVVIHKPTKITEQLERSAHNVSPTYYSNVALHAQAFRTACNFFPSNETYLVLDNDRGMEQNYRQLISNSKTKDILENKIGLFF